MELEKVKRWKSYTGCQGQKQYVFWLLDGSIWVAFATSKDQAVKKAQKV